MEEKNKIQLNRPTEKLVGSETKRVLHVVYGSDKPEPHKPVQHHESEEEDKVEVDERWLMTYADKMTLLCGLFIMLFAMSTMDQASQERVKESTKKTFGEPASVKEKEKKIQEEKEQKEKEIQEIKEQKVILETKVKELEQKVVQTEELRKEIEKLKQENVTLEKQANTTPDLRLQNMKLEKEVEELKKLKTPVVEKKIPPPTPKPKPKVQPQQIDPKEFTRLEERLEQEVNKVAEIKMKLSAADAQIVELKREIERSQTSAVTSAFLAFMIKWPTNDHDVDLTVEDPAGRKFDFKNRKYSGHPGMFVLDTRRGPGIEVWQADRIIPGTYKFNFQLYNAYGNKAPCPISGTLFSSKGSVEMPTVTLDTDSRRSGSVRVEIDDQGKARIR